MPMNTENKRLSMNSLNHSEHERMLVAREFARRAVTSLRSDYDTEENIIAKHIFDALTYYCGALEARVHVITDITLE
jgi:hypothetical protein